MIGVAVALSAKLTFLVDASFVVEPMSLLLLLPLERWFGVVPFESD